MSVGVVASFFNSMRQSIMFGDHIPPEGGVGTFLVIANCGIVGQFAAMFALMIIFRWMRVAYGGMRI